MIYRHTKEQVDNYYNRAEMNQSSVKVIISEGMQSYLAKAEQLKKLNDLYYEEKTHFVIGTAADHFITFGEQSYKDTYHFSLLRKKPKDKQLSIVHRVFDYVKNSGKQIMDFEIYKSEIYHACNEHDYYMNRRKASFEEDLRYKEILKSNGAEYWNELISAGNKFILADDQKITIDAITHSWISHPHTAHLFKPETYKDIIYQLPLYVTIHGVPCKALLDMVIVNHESKTIFPIDLKTIGDYVTKFNKAVKTRRYDIQAAFYTDVLSLSLDAVSKLVGKDVTSYRIANFAFIVESTIKAGVPIVFPLDRNLIEKGRLGDNEDLLGYRHGLEVFSDWLKNGLSLEAILKPNNGVVFVDEFFDYNLNCL